MLFKPGTALYAYEIARESGSKILYVNYMGANFVPSIAESSDVMSRTIDNLKEDSNVSRIVFVQQRNYSHDFSQVKMLVEVADLYDFLIKQERIVSPEKLSHLSESYHEAYAFLNYLLNELLKTAGVFSCRFFIISSTTSGVALAVNAITFTVGCSSLSLIIFL